MESILPEMLGYFNPDAEHDFVSCQNIVDEFCTVESIKANLRTGFQHYYHGQLIESDNMFLSILAQIQTCTENSEIEQIADELSVYAYIGRFFNANVNKGLKQASGFQTRAEKIIKDSVTLPEHSKVRQVMKLIKGLMLSFTGENVKAISTLNELLTASNDANENFYDLLIVINAHLRISTAKMRVRDYNSAENHLNQSIVLSKQLNYQYGLAESLRRKAIIFSTKKDVRESIATLNDAHDIFHSINCVHGVIKTLSSLGRNYSSYESKHAEFCLKKAIDLAKTHEFVQELGALYSQLGDFMMSQGRLALALVNYEKDRDLSQFEESKRRRAYINRNLGRIYQIQNSLIDAIKHLKIAMDDFQAVDDKTNYGFVALRLCQCYLDMNSLAESKQIEQEVRAIFGRNEGYESSLCDMMLGMIYRKEGHTEAAIQILQKSLANQSTYSPSFAYIRTNLELAKAYQDEANIIAYKQELINVIKLSRHLFIQEIEDKALELLREIDEKEWSRQRNVVYLGVSSDTQESSEVYISVMYADIRNYTHLTNNNEPSKMADFINDFFNIVSRIVYAHGGGVNKFIGDCVMSLFGLDKECTRSDKDALLEVANSAYLAAIEIAKSTELLMQRTNLSSEIEVGIGIATGPVIAGYFGNLERTEFSVIGATVNKASRIQNYATRSYALICENTANILEGKPYIENHDPVICKGFEGNVAVAAIKYPPAKISEAQIN